MWRMVFPKFLNHRVTAASRHSKLSYTLTDHLPTTTRLASSRLPEPSVPLESRLFQKRSTPFNRYFRNSQLLSLLPLAALFYSAQNAQCLTLSWDANTESNIAGYRIYTGTQTGIYSQSVDVGNKTSATAPDPAAGVTNFFTVTAYNSSALESARSIEVSKTGGTVTTTAATNIWPATTAPKLIDGGPDNPVELGVRFKSDVTGFITGIRFYKADTNTGTHVGNLWSSTGTKLATATFSAETASGWQQVNFATPVAITPNTNYVASYHANGGHYSADINYFATAGIDRAPLHALVNSISQSNGVYAYGTNSSFPNQTWQSANYWVDIVFAPGTSPAGTSPLTISTSALPNGSIKSAYSATLTASGGTTPYTWAVVGGALPSGLSLNASSGLISGTPTLAGAYSANFQLTDQSSPVQSVSKPLTLTVTAVTAPKISLWANTTVPNLVDGGPDRPVELGVKFRSDVAGKVTAIRFYKAVTNTGTHVGNLWSNKGTKLATATFNAETASGWQTVNLATPLAITANTVYIVSYHANSGHYSADANYFAQKGTDNLPLHALANGVSGGNGVYAYGATSAFPTLTWNAANYWVDVVFTP